ncbi:hypothetical protein IY230_01855 [Acholeplasma laidlawii]|uniref:hypothetical protein n=1 Tax=Acholeplasma laidlawii TaxID=2148 RepID=UPI0018C1E456|nr:hypothetical protein [Acholeplasma laidlawii]MBG0762355.1 hypothetical protein [Acholeplasma laidlawii]
MIIYMPNKRLWKFIGILTPFNLLSIVCIVLSVMYDNDPLLTITTIFILLIILVFSLGSRIIRKDNVILTKDSISFGLKDKDTSYLKMLFLQFEKDSTRFVDIIKYSYDEQQKLLTLHTKQGIKNIELKHFTSKVVLKITTYVDERINHG